MPYNIVLNSSNIVGTNNTQFLYKFINGSFHVYEGAEMCVSQIVIPFSWFNINTDYYQNATLSYRWYYGVGLFRTYTIIFPNGYYNTSNLNSYINQFCISQNQYFVNSTTGKNLYYIQLVTNATYYANTILCFALPTSLPTGYTAPTAGFNYNTGGSGSVYTAYGYPTTTLTPQVSIPAPATSTKTSTTIGAILGFSTGLYPPATQLTDYNINSNITPNATPVNSLIVQCDKISNQCAMPSTILDTFSSNNTPFGSNISYQPTYEKWISLMAGTYSQLNIEITDQNFNVIKANDPNTMISLLIRNGVKPTLEKEDKKTKEAINKIEPINFSNFDENLLST